MFYSTYNRALKALNSSYPTWYCPVIRDWCNRKCICYIEPEIETNEHEGVAEKFYLTEAGCSHFLISDERHLDITVLDDIEIRGAKPNVQFVNPDIEALRSND